MGLQTAQTRLHLFQHKDPNRRNLAVTPYHWTPPPYPADPNCPRCWGFGWLYDVDGRAKDCQCRFNPLPAPNPPNLPEIQD